MGLNDKALCTGPSGCGHPRYEHTGSHVKGTRTACRHRLANGRGSCACTEFRSIQSRSSVSESQSEAVDA